MSRQRNKNRLTNDLDSSEEEKDFSDFYSDEAPKEKRKPSDPEDILSRRNTWVIGIFIVVAVLWHFDWSPMKAAYGIGTSITNLFENEETQSVGQTSNSDAMSLTQLDYLDRVRQLDFGSTPSTSQITTLYNSGVSIDYLEALDDVDYLDELNYSGVIALNSNGVTSEYISGLEDLDYLDEVNYSGVIGLYTSGVPINYIEHLENIDYLDEVNYSGIIGLYTSGVPESYLSTLDDVDYLNEVNYSGIIGLYTSGVSEGFLQG
ncbi:MAG: hypothetical protein ABJF72_14790, partial [Balneola sp.]